MTDETTSEQLAEIEGQATEYTPPEGWRVVQVGEVLRDGDLWVNHEGELWPTKRVGERVNDERYIRPIEPQPEPVQVREGRWRTRGGEVKNIRSCEPLKGAYYVWPWTDGFMTFQDNGLHQGSKESPNDLVEYLGPIEPQSKPQPQPQAEAIVDLRNQLAEAKAMLAGVTQGREYAEANRRRADTIITELQHRISDLETINAELEATVKDKNAKLRERADEFRSEVSYVQNLLGESRQRVTQLEELVASLRTINEAQEKAFEAAGQDNTALRNQLAAVKAELVQERLERNRWHNQVLRVTAELDEKTTQCEILQIELDAAQQVPADSPEIRQLRADLEQVTRERDQYLDSYQRIFGDLETIRETTKAAAVEAIVEWLVPIRLADSAYLANATMQHLPSIMRHLTGLDSHAID